MLCLWCSAAFTPLNNLSGVLSRNKLKVELSLWTQLQEDVVYSEVDRRNVKTNRQSVPTELHSLVLQALHIKAMNNLQALLALWSKSALPERVQRRTSQRSVPYIKGHPIKITMFRSVCLQQCASLVLVRPSERAFRVFHSLRSLLSQEVCLTVNVGTMRTTRQIWKCRLNTPG